MESKCNQEKIQIYFNNVDGLLKDLYENKIPLEEVLQELDFSKTLSFIPEQNVDKDKILKSFLEFIKSNANYKIKGTTKLTVNNIKYYYKKFVEKISNSNCELSYKQIIELLGNLTFGVEGINCELKNKPKTNKEIIECYLINKVQLFIKNKSLKNNEKISEFIKCNHLLFCTDDSFQRICLRFFLIINLFLSEKYERFSNYNEFIMNFYYLYYKYTKSENLNKFRDEILSKIYLLNYSNFSFDEKFMNEEYISTLKKELEILKQKKNGFKLKINRNILNNNKLLKLFHLKKVDEEKVKRFFKFSTIQDNYLKFNQEQKVDLLVDNLNYNENKLHVFNIFFIINCGLIDKIERDSLQIFNGDNNVVSLLKKYADSLLETINEIIQKIKNKIAIKEIEENFGFGKIFQTFYVLYTDLNNEKYKRQKLKFDLCDNLVEKNIEKRPILKVNVNMEKSDINTHFTKLSQDTDKKKETKESYYEKLNGDSLEEGCKKYILSKIDDLVNENIEKIEFIEMFKILFSLNFFIPYLDNNGLLGFYPITKQLNNQNNNNLEYGFQEFDYLFKVSKNKNIYMNENNGIAQLPFVKNIQITIDCKNINNPVIKLEDGCEFFIKRDALVIVENKLKFPKSKELFLTYITVMLKKLNFIVKLIKNTTGDLYLFENVQLLLIYDDIIFNSEKVMDKIDDDEIKKIINDISFTETIKFTIEILYINQIVHYYNTQHDLKERKKMKETMQTMKNEIENLKNEINDLKSKIEGKK